MGLMRWLSRMQGNVLFGTITLTLCGDTRTKVAWVDISHELTEIGKQECVDDFMLLTRGWLLFLESQIRKLPSQLYSSVLGSLMTQAMAILRFQTYGSRKVANTPRQKKLATVTVEVWAGRDWFVLVHLKTKLKSASAIGLIINNSMPSLAHQLDSKAMQYLGCMIVRAAEKWIDQPPTPISAGTRTWDFVDLESAHCSDRLPIEECLSSIDSLMGRHS